MTTMLVVTSETKNEHKMMNDKKVDTKETQCFLLKHTQTLTQFTVTFRHVLTCISVIRRIFRHCKNKMNEVSGET